MDQKEQKFLTKLLFFSKVSTFLGYRKRRRREKLKKAMKEKGGNARGLCWGVIK